MARTVLTLREIVARLGGEAVGEVAAPLTGVATLDSAGPDQIAFLTNPKYRSRLAATRAGAVILGPGDRDAATIPRIVAENPYAYYARTVALFNPPPAALPGVHPTAQVAPDARVAASAEVGPFVVLGAALLVTFAICTVIFWAVPKGHMPWRAVWPGAAFVTIAAGLANWLFPIYLSNVSSLSHFGSTLGFILIALLWFYVLSLALLVGAVIN